MIAAVHEATVMWFETSMHRRHMTSTHHNTDDSDRGDGTAYWCEGARRAFLATQGVRLTPSPHHLLRGEPAAHHRAEGGLVLLGPGIRGLSV